MTDTNNSKLDTVLTAVLANRVDGIVREMTNTMLKTARSAVINSARDFSCAIVTGTNELFACAEGLPIHIFGTDLQTKVMCDNHPDIAEGDCYLHNDPYSGNTHAADHAFMVPVFFEGEHHFTAVAKAHQADCGNSLPTTYMSMAKDVYEEGALIFPAVRIQRDYKMVGDVVNMMQKRIRVPSQWYGDFMAGISSARIAERRLKEMCAKYGKETIKTFITSWLNYSEQRMVNAVRSLPAAKLENHGRHDSMPFLPEGIPLQVKVMVDPDSAYIDIDLRDNIDNVDCGLNQSEATATSAVLAGLFNSLNSDVPQNAGSFRRVRVHLREGAVAGIPKFPHSCSVATTNVSDRMINLTGAAFAQLGDGQGLAEGAVGPGIGMAVVSGRDPRFNGAPFINQIHLNINGGPASPKADGWITYGIPVVAGLMYRDSIEIDELKHPLEVRRLALIPGTGGAGRFRGAPSAEIEFGIKSDAMTVMYPGDGQEEPPKGVRGGLDGARAERFVIRKNGESTKLTNAARIELAPGDAVRGIDCSGGGYGSPLERDPERVLHDVLERYETEERAADVYGVIFDSYPVRDGSKVDARATDEKRRALATI
ncbi:hydantoinase B/oxoprolinase family protein [Rhizobium leguminosarum]|uniref:hydantoinase B/oxoprolinase family protein n=1 Tax=Rhizobium leguminosarum TaxID=384 RepID=UPI00160C94E1|nr:hydantoinase B/oxoprolinase family protein [Rhizobium leguminosarum]MBB4342970.1 N-methylhydantoinase B [Rhizobium leguminosarum]MBB6296048.1 N-methylhydantoinase B [Rhizobium leguminosarum]